MPGSSSIINAASFESVASAPMPTLEKAVFSVEAPPQLSLAAISVQVPVVGLSFQRPSVGSAR
ncbi:MAG: hypothetical protein BWX86_02232 [Verrucomicrobia bacterium ADurb.Bin122]|nr:MAG: hypothetical protein BWX86_02232 [Verrucomicrobia bacterium ADurb.Bin122]